MPDWVPDYWGDTHPVAAVAHEQDRPTHSPLLGPDGQPLAYHRPRLGFDLRPAAQRRKEQTHG